MTVILSKQLETGQYTGWSNAQGTTDYSKPESLALLFPSTRAGTPLGQTSSCL